MIMEKAEIKLLVAQELLAKAQKEHDAAVTALLLAKRAGTYTDEHHRKEVEKRHELASAERRYAAAKGAMQPVISDEEAARIGDYLAGNPSGWEADTETLTDEDEALVDAIADGLDV